MDIILIIGRIIFGALFLLSGFNHLKHLQGTTEYAASKKVPSPKLASIVTALLMILGALGVIFNYQTEIALWLLVIFLVPTSFIMHAFWKETDPGSKQMAMTEFLKNMSLAGAALMLIGM